VSSTLIKGPAALVVLDVDEMTRFNDTRGCLAGDAALVEIERILSAVATPLGVTVRRAGGDGFELVVPGADGLRVAEAARSAVAARGIALALALAPVSDTVVSTAGVAAGGACLTLSAGAALVETGETAPAFLVAAAAHAALNRAKRWGRNRVALDVVSGRDELVGRLPGVGPCAVILARINHLASYHDRFGRAAGDALLDRLGDALARRADRFGLPPPRRAEDTFALVVPDAARLPVADAVADYFRGLSEPHGHPDAGPTVTARLAIALVAPGARVPRARVVDGARRALAGDASEADGLRTLGNEASAFPAAQTLLAEEA
jgi:diguanylate cyclase (GGDEF)-like protein